MLTRKGSDERGVAPVDGAVIRVDSVEMDLLSMHVSSTPVIVVAVDTENKLYGYRQQDLGENLPQLYTSVIFRPWKQLKKYVDGSWRMINEFYVETPIEPEDPDGDTEDPDDGPDSGSDDGPGTGSDEGTGTDDGTGTDSDDGTGAGADGAADTISG